MPARGGRRPCRTPWPPLVMRSRSFRTPSDPRSALPRQRASWSPVRRRRRAADMSSPLNCTFCRVSTIQIAEAWLDELPDRPDSRRALCGWTRSGQEHSQEQRRLDGAPVLLAWSRVGSRTWAMVWQLGCGRRRCGVTGWCWWCSRWRSWPSLPCRASSCAPLSSRQSLRRSERTPRCTSSLWGPCGRPWRWLPAGSLLLAAGRPGSPERPVGGGA